MQAPHPITLYSSTILTHLRDACTSMSIPPSTLQKQPLPSSPTNRKQPIFGITCAPSRSSPLWTRSSTVIHSNSCRRAHSPPPQRTDAYVHRTQIQTITCERTCFSSAANLRPSTRTFTTDIHSQALLSKCPQPPSPTNRYVHAAVSLCPALDTRPERHVRPQFLVRCPQIPIICQRPQLRVVQRSPRVPEIPQVLSAASASRQCLDPGPQTAGSHHSNSQIRLTASVPPPY